MYGVRQKFSLRRVPDDWRGYAGVLICLLEIGYPVFIWPRRTRLIWLVSIMGMHVAIGLTMGMYLFALIMIVLNAAAFGPTVRLGRARGLLSTAPA